MFTSMRESVRHSKGPTTKGFTLAELLVVLAIMGIMLALALPAFINITGASALDASANAVHSAAKLARQHALAHNQPTYLIFHDDRNAYAIFSINIHADPVTQSDGYFLSNWESLPTGIVFDDTAEGGNNVFTVSEGDGWNGAFSKNNLLKINGTDYVVQGFDSAGKSSSATHWIHLAEGFYNNGQIQHTSKQGKQVRFAITGKSRIIDILYTPEGNAKNLVDAE